MLPDQDFLVFGVQSKREDMPSPKYFSILSSDTKSVYLVFCFQLALHLQGIGQKLYSRNQIVQAGLGRATMQCVHCVRKMPFLYINPGHAEWENSGLTVAESIR